jgi:hypothetical protein
MGEAEVVADTDLDLLQLRKWFVLRSSVLGGECVLVVSDEAYLDEARTAHPDLVVYFPYEVKELLRQGATPAFSSRIHMIKRMFDGVIVPQGVPQRLAGSTAAGAYPNRTATAVQKKDEPRVGANGPAQARPRPEARAIQPSLSGLLE